MRTQDINNDNGRQVGVRVLVDDDDDVGHFRQFPDGFRHQPNFGFTVVDHDGNHHQFVDDGLWDQVRLVHTDRPTPFQG